MTTETLTLRVCSTTDLEKSYTIRVQRDPMWIKCDCPGFASHQRCKHVKFYKDLIKKYLDVSPGF